MQLYLNLEWDRVNRVMDVADACRLATDEVPVPDDWIDLMTDDPTERARWRQREFRKE